MIPRRAASACLSLLTALALAACGGDDEPASGGTSTKTRSGVNFKAGLKLGDSWELKGLKGARMKVTVTRIEDPMKAPARVRPEKGRRFVGIHVRFENVGKDLYKDAPLNGTRIETTPDKAGNPSILIGGKCSSKFGTKARIAAGASRTACLPYQVKRGAKVNGVLVRLNSGYGPDVAQWKRG